ncbi:CcmD family protein [Puia sp.]|uniref:CcmD family protein n=1 Tax=Puia sp. TaxID=2045100 RepID=UPI002F411587
MHTKIRTLLILFFCWLLTVPAMAQNDTTKTVEMADGLRANGKIYVVVLVLVTILAGVILYVVRLDRKIHKLEKDLK